MDYKIALTSVVFNYDYKNVLRFESRAIQEAYFKVNTLFNFAPKCNFNATTLLNTRLVYVFNNAENLNELLMSNYAIVLDTQNKKYFYYFVKDAKQDCGNQILLDVELDVMQTFLIDLSFSDCVINRAHLNRFIAYNNDIKFNSGINSKLFENETNELPKRLTKRTQINLKFDTTENSKLNNWVNENVDYWQYIFVSPGNYNCYSTSFESPVYYHSIKYGTVRAVSGVNPGDMIDGGVAVMVFPVYKKTGGAMFVRRRNEYQDGDNVVPADNAYWGLESLESFKELNNDSSNFYYSKISVVPPFELANYVEGVDYEMGYGNASVIFLRQNFIPGYLVNLSFNFTYNDESLPSFLHRAVCRVMGQQPFSIPCYNYTIDKQQIFQKSQLLGLRNKQFNPKILSQNYNELKLVCGSYNFNYDIQKLGLEELELEYYEALTPDITRGYFRIKNTTGIYIDECSNNFTGLVYSADNSLPIVNDQLANMLANNKNYYLQAGLGIAQKGIKGIIGGAVAGGLKGGVGGAIAGGVSGVVSTGLDIANMHMTIDNMKNAPDIVINSNGNAVFNAGITKIGLYIEEYESLDNEQKIDDDSMFKNGFAYNEIGNPKEFENIRKYFNFIQANIEEFSANGYKISTRVHDKIKEIYRNGVRFWNVENPNEKINFNYRNENFERWLV